MHITEQTSTSLKLQCKDNSSRYFLWLLGSPFLLIGLAVMIFLGKLTTLKCDRLEPTQVACELTSAGLAGKKVIPIRLGQLQRADVEVNEDSDGDTYRVVLVTKTGVIPFTQSYSSGEGGKHRNAQLINTFLSNPDQPSLKVQQDDRWFAYPFGGIFALVGGSMILSTLKQTSQTTYQFDKQANCLSIQEKSWFKTKTRAIQMWDIQSAQVIEDRDSDGDKIYRTQLTLKSGETIPIPILGFSGNHHRIANTINGFLG